MSGFTLGQRVRFTRHIVRRSSREWEQLRPDRIWSSEAYPGHYLHGGEGIIIGRRTLTEGDVVWMGPEEQGVYRKTNSFTAYLVAFDLYRSPVHVLPEHITALEES